MNAIFYAEVSLIYWVDELYSIIVVVVIAQTLYSQQIDVDTVFDSNIEWIDNSSSTNFN